MAAGPVAVIECIQDIPCNPCEAACPFHAIRVGQPITSLPVLAVDKCIGCGACITQCPGLAIFIVDASRPGDIGTVQLPYEYCPRPQAGEVVTGLDRSGKAVADVKVVKTTVSPKADRTVVVTIEAPKSSLNMIRGIRVKGGEEHG
jgi:Fe-S-cluster-containing hydrogenase component 2